MTIALSKLKVSTSRFRRVIADL